MHKFGQNYNFPIKIVLPQGFPFHPPKVFLNMSLSVQMAKSKNYIGSQNLITIPYI